MKNYSKRKCCRFSFPIYDLFCVSIHFQPSFENVKMFIPTALAKDPGCTHSFVKFSALLPANEKLKKNPKIIGSTFPFLDIHLLSDFFHKNRFHPASPTEGLTSIQQLTLEKALEGCIYSICKMVQMVLKPRQEHNGDHNCNLAFGCQIYLMVSFSHCFPKCYLRSIF